MDTLPYELIHLIYDYLFSARDIIAMMSAGKLTYNHIPSNTRQILSTWKLRANIHNEIRNIKHFIADIWNVNGFCIELSIRISNKLVIYQLIYDDDASTNMPGPGYFHAANNNETTMIQDEFVDIYFTSSKREWYLAIKSHRKIIKKILPIIVARGLKVNNHGIVIN